jgi:uncharacterized membrane protein
VSWFTFWLILHILAAVVAFGPTFAFPIIGVMARRQPMHAAFATEVTVTVSERFTIPFALSMPITGTALIVAGHIPFWSSDWLVGSIGLYVVAILYSIGVQRPAGLRMIRLLERVPTGDPGVGATAPAGSPPDVAVLGKKLATGGQVLGPLTLGIFVLMIWRPGAG